MEIADLKLGQMIRFLQTTLRHKKIINNFLSLASLQMVNNVLPLLTIPYLVRVLGPEGYGAIVFAQSFIQYFVILTDYGFNLSATRRISTYRNDHKKIVEIFSAVMSIKILLGLASFAVILILVSCVNKLNEDVVLYLLTFGTVIGSILFTSWFFQGIEDMKYITLLNVISKTLSAIMIFLFVKLKSDYILVPLISLFGNVIVGIIGLFLIKRKYRVRYKRVSKQNIVEEFREGWHIFVSQLAISSYTITNTFILGVFTNNTTVGYYSAADKIVKIIVTAFYPLFNALYPHIAFYSLKSRKHMILLLRRLMFLTGSLSAIIFLLLQIYSETIILLIFGSSFYNSILLLKVLSPLVIIIPIAYIFANLGLLTFRLDKYNSRIYILGAAINIASLIIFIKIMNLGAIGSSLTTVLTELTLTTIMYVVLHKNNVKLLFLTKENYKRSV